MEYNCSLLHWLFKLAFILWMFMFILKNQSKIEVGKKGKFTRSTKFAPFKSIQIGGPDNHNI